MTKTSQKMTFKKDVFYVNRKNKSVIVCVKDRYVSRRIFEQYQEQGRSK